MSDLTGGPENLANSPGRLSAFAVEVAVCLYILRERLWRGRLNVGRQCLEPSELDSAGLLDLQISTVVEIPDASQRWRGEYQENCRTKWPWKCRAARAPLATTVVDSPSA